MERGNAAVGEHTPVTTVCSVLQQQLCNSHPKTTPKTHQRLTFTHMVSLEMTKHQDFQIKQSGSFQK